MLLNRILLAKTTVTQALILSDRAIVIEYSALANAAGMFGTQAQTCKLHQTTQKRKFDRKWTIGVL